MIKILIENCDVGAFTASTFWWIMSLTLKRDMMMTLTMTQHDNCDGDDDDNGDDGDDGDDDDDDDDGDDQCR